MKGYDGLIYIYLVGIVILIAFWIWMKYTDSGKKWYDDL